ncbi:MAG TPA: hypothetical protein VIC33_05850 [Vicinamibacterales bacterium]|jgi:hypothetical protein
MMTSTYPELLSDTRIVEQIRDEYLDMPGLSLTPAQARRLWTLDHEDCAEALGSLVVEQFLARTRDGRYVRADRGVSCR